MTEIKGMHHVMIAIPKGGEAEARAFYGEALGLRELPKPETLQARGGVWFQSSTLQLHLGVDPDFVPATKAHVAFEVVDLDAARQRCLAAGHPVRDDGDLPGYARFYTDDPFGNRVETLQPTEATRSIVDSITQGSDVG